MVVAKHLGQGLKLVGQLEEVGYGGAGHNGSLRIGARRTPPPGIAVSVGALDVASQPCCGESVERS